VVLHLVEEGRRVGPVEGAVVPRERQVADGVEFHDLGDQYFVQHDKTRLANRLLQRLRDLGIEVEIKAA